VPKPASEFHLFGDRLAGRRILAKAECVQELVNHDDLSIRAIPPISELPPAHANEPGARLCERHRHAGAALWRVPVIVEP
jgi:hypothetical protein